jgi:hypothetical protein
MSRSCTKIRLKMLPLGKNTKMSVNHKYQAERKLLNELALCIVQFTLENVGKESRG